MNIIKKRGKLIGGLREGEGGRERERNVGRKKKEKEIRGHKRNKLPAILI